jgi:uncharacterized protein with von Willebrand factor type A (vWA) domain
MAGIEHLADAVTTKVCVDAMAAHLEKKLRQEKKRTIEWVAGMMIVQTVAILTGTVGLVKLII